MFLGDRLDELDQPGGRRPYRRAASFFTAFRLITLPSVTASIIAVTATSPMARTRLVLRHDVHLNHRAAAKRPTPSRGRG